MTTAAMNAALLDSKYTGTILEASKIIDVEVMKLDQYPVYAIEKMNELCSLLSNIDSNCPDEISYAAYKVLKCMEIVNIAEAKRYELT